MHETVFYLAAVWMTGLLGLSVLLVIRARSTAVRILALDQLTLILIAFLVLYAAPTARRTTSTRRWCCRCSASSGRSPPRGTTPRGGSSE